MRAQPVVAALLAVCGLASAAEPLDFPLKRIEARLRVEAHGYVPVVLTTPHCTSAAALPAITSPSFPSAYPDGVFVVCDAATSGTRADATILRYLFHASRKEVLVASSIHARLDHRSGAWRLVAWRETYYDYAP